MLCSNSVAAVALLAIIPRLVFSAEIPSLQPGDVAPPFVLQEQLMGKQALLKYNKTAKDSNIHGPIVFLAYTKRSGFLEGLFPDRDCLKELLEYSPDNTNYIFLYYGDSSPTVGTYTVQHSDLPNTFKDCVLAYYCEKSSRKSRACRFQSRPRVSTEGLNGVNRQPSNGQKNNRQPSKRQYFYRQPSIKPAIINRQTSNGLKFNRQPSKRLFFNRQPSKIPPPIETLSTPNEFYDSWKQRVHFATFPVSSLGNWIPRVLSQWYCSGHGCGFDQIVIENEQGEIHVVSKRLDARYDWLPSPNTLDKYGHLLMVYVGDACDVDKFKNVVDGKLALVSMEDAKCSYFTKVQNCEKNGALGVVVYPPRFQGLTDMNCNGSECNTQLNIPATMIPHELGYLQRTVTNLYVRYQNTPSDTFLFGIDGEGKVEEAGWLLYPSLRFLAYQAQWFNYKTQLLKTLTTGDAEVINVFNHTTMQGQNGINATVDLPSIHDIQRYEHVELDFSLSCPGSRDMSCAKWDHVVQLYVCCNLTSELCGLELGRWITAFRRGIGHWLTPVKPLIPLLQTANSSSPNKCKFTMKTVPWAMAWVSSLNIRLVNEIKVLPMYKTFRSMEQTIVPFQVMPLFRGGTFDKNYNSKYTPVTFNRPTGKKKVKLVAIITGHGSDNNNCAEFCVTSHHFVVNNKQSYTRVFKDAGTALGCAEHVAEGVVPNEHGTWLYGRDGWCDGQEVVPWVVDITDSLQDYNNTIKYFGWFNNADPNPTRDPGEIIMYSYLVYYENLT